MKPSAPSWTVYYLHADSPHIRREDLSYLLHSDLHTDGPVTNHELSASRREVAMVSTSHEQDLGIIGVWPKKASTHFLATPLGMEDQIYQLV
jgi:hypothetical protein